MKNLSKQRGNVTATIFGVLAVMWVIAILATNYINNREMKNFVESCVQNGGHIVVKTAMYDRVVGNSVARVDIPVNVCEKNSQ